MLYRAGVCVLISLFLWVLFMPLKMALGTTLGMVIAGLMLIYIVSEN